MAEEGKTGNMKPRNAPSRDLMVRNFHRFIATPEKFPLSMFAFNKSLNCSAHLKRVATFGAAAIEGHQPRPHS
ncbi:MAG: hypothetical protein Q8K35_00470 [Thiobacillus sp.]|nr:hypothetical protein [Thiobacillus sp.]MDP2056219.1 hypothetical protein [Thiobacillus sp.]